MSGEAVRHGVRSQMGLAQEYSALPDTTMHLTIGQIARTRLNRTPLHTLDRFHPLNHRSMYYRSIRIVPYK